MNWIKENKFLFGFLVVMALGAGVLGFLVFSAMGSYDDARAGYDEKATELKRLQGLVPYPNQQNLDRLAEQKKEVTEAAAKFGQNLASQELPIEPITPEQFQDRLKASVSAVRAKAAQNGVKIIPEKFYLGFERYETAPPDREVASLLGWQLKGVEWVVNTLIDSRVVELRALNRPELPQESGKAKVEEKKTASGKADKSASSRQVMKHPFDVVFLAEQDRFRQVLNSIVSYQGQFFIPRVVTMKNEKEKGPPRAVPGVPAFDPAAAAAGALPATNPDGTPAAPAAPPAAAAPVPAAPPSAYIVGEERIEVSLTLEAVHFAEVAATK